MPHDQLLGQAFFYMAALGILGQVAKLETLWEYYLIAGGRVAAGAGSGIIAGEYIFGISVGG